MICIAVTPAPAYHGLPHGSMRLIGSEMGQPQAADPTAALQAKRIRAEPAGSALARSPAGELGPGNPGKPVGAAAKVLRTCMPRSGR